MIKVKKVHSFSVQKFWRAGNPFWYKVLKENSTKIFYFYFKIKKLIFLFFQNGNKTDLCGSNGHLLPVQQKLEIFFIFLSDHSGIVTFVPVFQIFVYLFEIQSTNSKVKQNLWLTWYMHCLGHYRLYSQGFQKSCISFYKGLSPLM